MSNILVVSMGWADRKSPVGNFEFDQAMALKNSGHNVQILAIDRRIVLHSKRIFAYDTTLDGIKIRVVPLHIWAFPKKIRYSVGRYFLSLRYKGYVESSKVDIIHVHWGPNCFLVSRLAKKASVPLVSTEHNSLVNMPNPISDYFKISSKGYLEADKLLCVSSCLKKNLLTSTGLDFEIVPNVLDPTIFGKDFRIHEKEKRTTIELISVGHLLPIKNFELLINCIRKIDNKNIKLRIFGEGKLKNELQDLINSCGLQNVITLEGNVERKILVKALLESDAFVLLSKSETFGVAFIEAMACGLPVFSSNCGGTDDIITSERYGVIADIGNENGLLVKLKLFIDNLDNYNRKEISQYALANYSNDILVNKLNDVYKEIKDNLKC